MPVLFCGDFNAVVDPHKDRKGCNPQSNWANNWSSTHKMLFDSFNLSDCWWVKNPNTHQFTWQRPNGLQASRLDMIWVPTNFLNNVRKIEILPFFRSDHSYVYLELDLPKGTERGSGIWKFNVDHLNDDNYKIRIKEFWTT